MYTTQPAGRPQPVDTRDVDGVADAVGDVVGDGVGDADGDGVGDAVGVWVGGTAVSVGGTGVDEGEGAVGEAVTVGRGGVGEGSTMATAWVGDGGTVGTSSWLNRKPPSNMPTLTSVATRPTSSCLIPVALLALAGIRSLNVDPTPQKGETTRNKTIS